MGWRDEGRGGIRPNCRSSALQAPLCHFCLGSLWMVCAHWAPAGGEQRDWWGGGDPFVVCKMSGVTLEIQQKSDRMLRKALFNTLGHSYERFWNMRVEGDLAMMEQEYSVLLVNSQESSRWSSSSLNHTLGSKSLDTTWKIWDSV